MSQVFKRVPFLCDDDFISDKDVPPEEPRKQSDYLDCYTTSVNFAYEQALYKLRAYQEELAVHANQGRNTIICAPTGCEKTIVATDIILNHLRNMRKQKKVARAVVLVPTAPLVDQQTIELMRYMASEFRVDGFNGAEYLPNRAGSFLAADVCVLTPQLVINMMDSVLKSEKIYFSDITLMIIDECHDCSEQNPYKTLMEMLEASGIKKKLQIVGLTASLSVGQTSWNISACREHMLKMCSYLFADSISAVRHHLENLKVHVPPPVDNVEHSLKPSWTFWVWRSDSEKWKPADERSGNEWTDCLHEMCTISSIETFWALQHRVVAANQLRYGTDYIFFQEGIKPMWEDLKNIEGGVLYIDVKKACKHTKLNRYWTELLMAILGGQFQDYNKYINGAFLNIRSRGDKLSMWISTCEPEVVRAIQEIVDVKLDLGTSDRIYFKKHNTNK